MPISQSHLNQEAQNRDRDNANIRESVEKLNNTFSRTVQKLDGLADDVATIREVLLGNGDPSKSVVIRLDRCENTVSRWSKTIGVALGASITALITTIVKLLVMNK